MRALNMPHFVPGDHSGKELQEEPEQKTNHRNVQTGLNQEMGISLMGLTHGSRVSDHKAP